MSYKYATEDQVKTVMGITDWRHLSKEKLMNFVSILPDVDNDVAIKIIEQFPEFSKNSLTMIDGMKDVCKIVLEEDKYTSEQSIEAYRLVLDELSLLLKKENISTEEMKYIADKMVDVADKIGAKDTESKDYKGKVLGTLGGVVIAALAIGASIVGVKFLDSNGRR